MNKTVYLIGASKAMIENQSGEQQINCFMKMNYKSMGEVTLFAFDMQLIKGVLPDLFAVLKFLESDDDLVFHGIICRYF